MAWYADTNWNYKKKITIDKHKVEANHTDFPILVSVTDNQLKDTSNGGYVGKSDGTDILFTNSDGTTKLDHEIETYTNTTGKIEAWVEIPTMDSSTDKDIYMYFGYAGASDQQNVNGTWNSGYEAVWHMNDNTTSTILDSTSHDCDGTKGAANQPLVNTDGKVGDCQDFGTASDTYEIDVTDSDLDNAYVTVEAWVRWGTGESSTKDTVFSRQNTNHGTIILGGGYDGNAAGQLTWQLRDSSENFHILDADAAGSDNTWYYWVGTYDGSDQYCYVDGVQQADTASWSDTISTGSLTEVLIGGHTRNNNYWAGEIDEVRVSNTARSANWIKTTYNTINSPSTFISFAGLEARDKISGGLKYWSDGIPMIGQYDSNDANCKQTRDMDYWGDGAPAIDIYPEGGEAPPEPSGLINKFNRRITLPSFNR